MKTSMVQMSLFDMAIEETVPVVACYFYDHLDTIVEKYFARRKSLRFSEIRDRFDIWQLTLPESERINPSPSQWGKYSTRLKRLGFSPTSTVLQSTTESRKGGADRVWVRK